MVSQLNIFVAQINAAGTAILHALGGVSEDALGTKGKEEHERRISRDTLVDARCLGSACDGATALSTADVKKTRQISTGRGGSGNFVAPQCRLAAKENQRQCVDRKVTPKVISTGRGGAGNIRHKPDQDKQRWGDGTQPSGTSPDGPLPLMEISEEAKEIQYEREVMARHLDKQMRSAIISSGRGGAGNINHIA